MVTLAPKPGGVGGGTSLFGAPTQPAAGSSILAGQPAPAVAPEIAYTPPLTIAQIKQLRPTIEYTLGGKTHRLNHILGDLKSLDVPSSGTRLPGQAASHSKGYSAEEIRFMLMTQAEEGEPDLKNVKFPQVGQPGKGIGDKRIGLTTTATPAVFGSNATQPVPDFRDLKWPPGVPHAVQTAAPYFVSVGFQKDIGSTRSHPSESRSQRMADGGESYGNYLALFDAAIEKTSSTEVADESRALTVSSELLRVSFPAQWRDLLGIKWKRGADRVIFYRDGVGSIDLFGLGGSDEVILRSIALRIRLEKGIVGITNLKSVTRISCEGLVTLYEIFPRFDDGAFESNPPKFFQDRLATFLRWDKVRGVLQFYVRNWDKFTFILW
jgi:hypothetical protein